MIASIIAALALGLGPCCPAEPLHAGSLVAFAVTTTGVGKSPAVSGGGGSCSGALDFSDACNSASIVLVVF